MRDVSRINDSVFISGGVNASPELAFWGREFKFLERVIEERGGKSRDQTNERDRSDTDRHETEARVSVLKLIHSLPLRSENCSV